MNKNWHWLRVLFFVWFIALLASCATTSPPASESAGEYIDDATITTKVKAAVPDDPMLKVLQIKVETYKGVVLLSGFVDTAQMADHATEVAQKVKGVKSVRNELVVKSSVEK